MKLAKYLVRYKSEEYYEKEYEADSFEEAERLYYEDDGLWESGPYDSDTSIIEIEDENGRVDTVED